MSFSRYVVTANPAVDEGAGMSAAESADHLFTPVAALRLDDSRSNEGDTFALSTPVAPPRRRTKSREITAPPLPSISPPDPPRRPKRIRLDRPPSPLNMDESNSLSLKLPDSTANSNGTPTLCTPVDAVRPVAYEQQQNPYRGPNKRLREAFVLPPPAHPNLSQPLLPDMSQDTLALFPRIIRTHVKAHKPSGIAKAALMSSLNRASGLSNPFVATPIPTESSEETPARAGGRRLSNVPPASAGLESQEQHDDDAEQSEREALKKLLVVASQPRKFSLDFEELGVAGEGDFSQVIRARSRIDGMLYAVKRNKKTFTCDKMKLDALKEVFALAALQGHPAILRYHAAWFEHGGQCLYIQTAFLTGGNVYDNYVNEGRKMPAKRLRALIQCIGGAMKFMHARNVVHHDIKPDNIFEDLPIASEETDAEPRYVLGDFGLVAREDSASVTEGDSRYLCPEALNRVWDSAANSQEDESPMANSLADFMDVEEGAPKPKSRKRGRYSPGDVFSLGVTIYELATGEPVPKSGEMWSKLRSDTEAAVEDVENACGDGTVANIARVCLELDPKKRASASTVLKMLDEEKDLRAENERLAKALKETRGCLNKLLSSATKVQKPRRSLRRASRRALGESNR